MSDYIKREEAISRIRPIVGWWVDKNTFAVDINTVLSILETLDTADVEPVVHCKDCKSWHKADKGDGFGVCAKWSKFLSADKDVETHEGCFCCYGKRKE